MLNLKLLLSLSLCSNRGPTRLIVWLFMMVALGVGTTSANFTTNSSDFAAESIYARPYAQTSTVAQAQQQGVAPLGPQDMLIEAEDHSFLRTLSRTILLFFGWG